MSIEKPLFGTSVSKRGFSIDTIDITVNYNTISAAKNSFKKVFS